MSRQTFRRLGIAVLATAFVAFGLLGPSAPSATAGGGGCHVPPSPHEAVGTTIAINTGCFEPPVLRAQPGETIRITNREPIPHNAAGVAGEFGTYNNLQEGDFTEFSFDEPGVYTYSCSLHFGMSGAIVIGDGQASTRDTSASSTNLRTNPDPSNTNADEPEATVVAAGGDSDGALYAAIVTLGVLAAGGVAFAGWTLWRR